MRRAVFKGAFLFVEGPSDARFYGKFVCAELCQIIVGYSRFNVIEACRILEKEQFAGVVGIVDADFDHLHKNVPDLDSVFQTDMHDADCFMLSAKTFLGVLVEFCSSDKLSEWEKKYGVDLPAHLLSQCVLIGAFLWYSRSLNLELSFDDLEPKEYCGSESLNIDLVKLVRHVKNKSRRHDLAEKTLISGIQEYLAKSDQHWQVIRGHDVIDVLCFALRKTVGSCNALEATKEHLRRALRLVYSEEFFSQTVLFNKIRTWEAENPPYKIFRDVSQGAFKL
jgi:hypothetical protein